jgi:hypothetical protein
MNPSLDPDARDGLRIREGGGCLGVFGLPFFGAGVFLLLITAGVIPLSNADILPSFGWPLLALMGAAFTAVGGWLTFGRTWTTIDAGQRRVRTQWGLLVPMRETVRPFDGATAVSLGFVQGDSDSADRYPVGLMIPGSADLQLADFTDYGQARACARAVAEHLSLDIEDASSDHAIRLRANQVDLSFRERWRARPQDSAVVEPPPDTRCRVSRDGGETTLRIPSRRPHVLAMVAGLAPVVILALVAPPLSGFFRQTRTPDPVGWAFLGFMTLVLGVIPALSVLNALRRAAHGETIVVVSPRSLRILERGAWRTRTVATVDGADILDVDFSVRESALAAARRATERDVQRLRQTSGATVGPRMERMMTALSRFVSAKGIVLKTRRGIEGFGHGLEDAEIRYLADVVRRALVQ